MNVTYDYIGLIKIGDISHMTDLQKNGLIFSQTLDYFRKMEKEEFKLRRDASEGAIRSYNIYPKEICIGNHKIPVTNGQGRLNEYDPNDDHTHVFCLYSLSSNFIGRGEFIDKRNFSFGKSALVIYKPLEFFDRIKIAVSSKYEFEVRPVEYYDENGDFEHLTIFNKPKYFVYQNEMRIHFKTKGPKPLKFSIGSIEDISLLVDSSQLKHLKMDEQSA